MFDIGVIEDCRQRNGSAADDRPEWVDEWFSPDEQLGYGQGLPLVGDSYDDYPREDGVLHPDSEDFLRELVKHPRVNSVSDVAEEIIGATEDRVEGAIDMHDISVEDQFGDEGDDESADGSDDHLQMGDTEVPTDHLHDPIHKDDRVLYVLLAEGGMSLDEVREFLRDEVGHSCSPHDLRVAVKDAGLLE